MAEMFISVLECRNAAYRETPEEQAPRAGRGVIKAAALGLGPDGEGRKENT